MAFLSEGWTQMAVLPTMVSGRVVATGRYSVCARLDCVRFKIWKSVGVKSVINIYVKGSKINRQKRGHHIGLVFLNKVCILLRTIIS